MDGLRLDDIISGNREGSLTEDEIVEYVQSGDPTIETGTIGHYE